MAAIGVVAYERKCRRCGHWYVIVMRVSVGVRPSARIIAKIRKEGRGEADLRHALEGIRELTVDEVEFLLAVVRSLATRAEEAAV